MFFRFRVDGKLVPRATFAELKHAVEQNPGRITDMEEAKEPKKPRKKESEEAVKDTWLRASWYAAKTDQTRNEARAELSTLRRTDSKLRNQLIERFEEWLKFCSGRLKQDDPEVLREILGELFEKDNDRFKHLVSAHEEKQRRQKV